MKTLTVISPVFNEAQVIEMFYRELKRTLESLETSYQCNMVFVVDRSSDRSLEILEQLALGDQTLRILSLSSRFGHQVSLLAGIDQVDSDVVIMMDSDLQHPPSLIPRLLSKYEEGYDIVYTIRTDDQEIGFLKRWTSRVFYRLLNRLSQVPIEESAADFRLITRRVAQVFQKQIRERNQFLRGLFVWVGFNSAGVEFQCGQRQGGSSKYSWGGLVRFAANGVVAFSKRPLQAAVFMGIGFALLGFALAIITIVGHFTNGSWPPGWATLAILIPIFSGVQLIFLGIIGEYIAAIFDEVKARPHYIVDKRVNFHE
jgi:dolichol-phosphate mannosyltransferase